MFQISGRIGNKLLLIALAAMVGWCIGCGGSHPTGNPPGDLLGAPEDQPGGPNGQDAADSQQPGDSVGRNAGGFFPGAQFSTSSPGIEISSGEVDGNPGNEIIVTLLGGGLTLMLNNCQPGVPQFATIPFDEGQGQINSAGCGDLSGDGLVDLVVSRTSGEIETYLQTDPFGFALHNECNSVGVAGVAFDLINSDDSVLDILVASDSLSGLGAYYYDESLSPYFPSVPAVSAFNTPDSITNYVQMSIADIDGDGLDDVVLLDAGEPELQYNIHLPVDSRPLYVWDEEYLDYVPAPAGYIDPLVTTNWGSSTYNMAGMAYKPLRFAQGDLDNDGILDLALLVEFADGDPAIDAAQLGPSAMLTPSSHVILIFQHSLAGAIDPGDDPQARRYVVSQVVSVLVFPGWVNGIQIADIDDDGFNDLVGCTENPPWNGGLSYLFYFPGLGDFTFDDPVGWLLYESPLRLLVDDLDGDGFPDAAVLEPLSNIIEVRLNDGGSGLGEGGELFAISN